MELALTHEEQALVVEVLQESSLSAVRKAARDNLMKRLVDRKPAFQYGELEDLADFLAETSRRLHDQYRRTEDLALQSRQQAVQRILDKVIEAEALV
jgi:hypothetical protein